MYASQKGDIEITRLLLQQSRVDVDPNKQSTVSKLTL